jgi:hypothetical protein
VLREQVLMELMLRLPSAPTVLSRAERVVVPSWAYRFLSQAQDYREPPLCRLHAR